MFENSFLMSFYHQLILEDYEMKTMSFLPKLIHWFWKMMRNVSQIIIVPYNEYWTNNNAMCWDWQSLYAVSEYPHHFLIFQWFVNHFDVFSLDFCKFSGCQPKKMLYLRAQMELWDHLRHILYPNEPYESIGNISGPSAES